MSATAFQRLRRETEAKKHGEINVPELTKKEIMAQLDEKGIDYDAKANKEALFKILEGAE